MFGHKIVILPKQPTLVQLLEHQLLEAERNELDVSSELEQARVQLATLEMRKHQASARIHRLSVRLVAAKTQVSTETAASLTTWRETRE